MSGLGLLRFEVLGYWFGFRVEGEPSGIFGSIVRADGVVGARLPDLLSVSNHGNGVSENREP